MTMLAQSFTTDAMADALQLRAFGKWASRDDNLRKLKCMDSVMFKEYRAPNHDDPKEIIPDIDPDYAMELDKAMLDLQEHTRKVLVSYYVFGLSWRAIARQLNSRPDAVCNHRDMAVSFLYGKLHGSIA